MTKEKVLRALEICKDVNSGIGCSSCPYLEMKNSSCLVELLNDACKLLKTEVMADER